MQATVADAGSSSNGSRHITVRNIERWHWAQPWRKNNAQLHSPVCTFELPDAAKGWKGPRLNLSLPSFRWALPAACCSCCNGICLLVTANKSCHTGTVPLLLNLSEDKCIEKVSCLLLGLWYLATIMLYPLYSMDAVAGLCMLSLAFWMLSLAFCILLLVMHTHTCKLRMPLVTLYGIATA